MRFLKLKFVSILLFVALGSTAQSSFHTGLIFDTSDLRKMKQKVVYRNSTAVLPSQVSLKSYAPTALKQMGETCLAHSFANAYSIHANQSLHLTEAIQKEVWRYSHEYLYALAKFPTVLNCEAGLRFPAMIDTIKKYGIVLRSLYKGDCAATVPPNIIRAGQKNRPTELSLLFTNVASHMKIQAVKWALKEAKPVVSGWSIDNNLSTAKNVWKPTLPTTELHAMTIVGYDDNYLGGAFEILNSWGVEWGSQGYIWVRYADFAERCLVAVEVPPLKETFPKDEWIPQPQAVEINISLRNEANQVIPISKVSPLSKTDTRGMGKRSKFQYEHWIVQKPMYSGDAYQIWIDALESTFIYVLSSDASNQVIIQFPEAHQSALLAKGQNIKLPATEQVFFLDETVGMDYICLLFSKEVLNIEEIRQKVAQWNPNNFLQSIEMVLKDKLIDAQKVRFGFEDSSLKGVAAQHNTILPVMIQIEHIQKL